jgi:hypothetical protein
MAITIQERNSEMVQLLATDFQLLRDPAHAASKMKETIQSLPALAGHWSVAGGDYYGVVGAEIYNDSDISVSNATFTVLQFNSIKWDSHGLADVSSGYRITVPVDGVYLITSVVRFDNNSTGYRYNGIFVNGGTNIVSAQNAVTNASTYMVNTQIYRLTGGSYVQTRVYQNSGGALDVVYQGNVSPYLRLVRIGN